jgi:hypothetical protein
MASPTTPITTYAGHAAVYESRHQVTLDTRSFSTYLHFTATRDGSWNGANPSPTFFELMDAIWTCVHSPWMDFHATGILSLTKLRVSEVTDINLGAGQPVPVYGDFCELVDFTGFFDDVTSVQTVGYPTAYYPSYTSIYALKQKDASPRNINGSLRYGPVLVNWAVANDPNRLDGTIKADLQSALELMIAGFQVTASAGGNTVDVQLGILRKTPAIGLGAPWNFMAVPDRIKVRHNLGTQNTRKRTRNTYV